MKYYSFNGRVMRREFWRTLILGGMIHFAAWMAVMFTDVSNWTLILISISGWWFSVAVSVKRCKDIGISPWWVCCMFMPYIGIFALFAIGFLKTNQRKPKLVW